MRRLLVLSLLVLLAAVGLVALIEHDAGYVLVSYGRMTLETSVWIALILLVSVFYALHVLLRAWKRLLNSSGQFGAWFRNRGSRHSLQRTNDGFSNFIAGNWRKARRQLLAGARNAQSPLLNYLIAARASDRLGEDDETRNNLQLALESDAEALTSVELTRAEIFLANGELDKANAVLTPIRDRSSTHPRVLDLLYQVSSRRRDWQQLAGLLPELRKRKLLRGEALSRVELEIARDALDRAAQTGTPDENREALLLVWKNLNEATRQAHGLLLKYLDLLLQNGGESEGEKLILRQLKQNWDSQLVRRYGLLTVPDPSRQLGQAENWLKQHPEDGELLLCAGRLALRNELWGKARDYFKASNKLSPRAETCAELGRLLANLGDAAASADYFRSGLLLTQGQLPQLPQPVSKTI